MKKLNKSKLKPRGLFNYLPNEILSEIEKGMIKGGLKLVVCTNGSTLKASDHPGADDYSCCTGATLTNIVSSDSESQIDTIQIQI